MSGVLVVCTANVCRSPLIASILSASGVFGDAVISSVGIRAASGGTCDVASAVADRVGAPLDPARVPHQLTVDDIEDADLILTAEVEQRSTVAQLAPTARGRTFTVLQAVHLARLLDPATRPLSDDVPGFTHALGLTRGLAASAPPRIWRRHDGWTLPDGHGLPFALHRLRVDATANAARELVGVAGGASSPLAK